MLTTPKNHHFVWGHYLTSWAQPGCKKVWYETSKGKIANDSVTGLSREYGFNKISKLRPIDLSYLELWPSGGSALVQAFQARQLEYFRKASDLIGCHEGKEGTPRYSALKRLSEHMEYGVFENTHTVMENLVRPILDQFKIGNYEILKNEGNTANFCNFLAQQLFRTKKIKEQCFSLLGTLNRRDAVAEEFRELFERNWWFLSYRLATNVGSSLTYSAESDNYVFIENRTSVDFITSDCPVINIHESAGGGLQNPPTELDLYFPISPKLACIISPSDKYIELGSFISERQVEAFNERMALNSYLTVYATSKQAVKDAQSYKARQLRL